MVVRKLDAFRAQMVATRDVLLSQQHDVMGEGAVRAEGWGVREEAEEGLRGRGGDVGTGNMGQN